jgi:arylsulfatase A-like enzyme
MQNRDDFSRRKFLGRLGAGAILGAASLGTRRTAFAGGAWTPPPVLTKPNILIVMVDQMRLPTWLSPTQVTQLGTTILPNIVGRIQNNSYAFGQYYTAATNCTPSRATILTGLYAPQTAIYCSQDSGSTPPLLPDFPTWGDALAVLDSAYNGNVWWFGKWHLSDNRDAQPLSQYGFKTRTYPGGPPPYNPSPNGTANEGTDGGFFKGVYFARDSDIAGDFVGWIEGQAPTSGAPSSPWCATVSLINPHDIDFAPGWLVDGTFPPPGLPLPSVYFPPPSDSANPPAFYTAEPSPWNYEDLSQVTDKPSLQYTLQQHCNFHDGKVKDWVLFLNQYYWLQNLADYQVGLVLDALNNSKFVDNTVVIFLADHGEYAGSHGLHQKGWAAYDEAIHVPLNVMFPGQSGAIPMNQMCSSVDFFGLVCDLATKGLGLWKKEYQNLANRQSLWSFLYNNSGETRVAPAPVGLPYILHTFDELGASSENPMAHIVCLRTKQDPAAGQIGAKLAFYWEWADCTTYPNSTAPDPEFYDYATNTSELRNDYDSTDPTVQDYTQVLGSWGPPATGIIGTELNVPLTGRGTTGLLLSQALTTAQQNYYNFAFGKGKCVA